MLRRLCCSAALLAVLFGLPEPAPAPAHVPAYGALAGCRTCGDAVDLNLDATGECRTCLAWLEGPAL